MKLKEKIKNMISQYGGGHYKQIIPMVVAISFLLLLTLGATYAFFQISVKNNTTEANVNLHAGELNNVALSQGVKSLHITLSANDMSTSNTGDYYAVTDGSNYKKGEENVVTIASIKTEGTIKDTCSGEIVVSISEDMADVLQLGDAILYIKGGSVTETLDLYNIKTDKTKTYTAYFEIDTTQNTEQNIQAWLKVVNKSDSSQNYLAGTRLNLIIDINNFQCGVEKAKGEDPLTLMRRTDTNNTLGGEDQATAVDGLIRYKGTYEEVENNYICFGTDDEGTCTDDKDTYMYRIIGITSGLSDAQQGLGLQEGQLKLIKAVPPMVEDTSGCTYRSGEYPDYTYSPCDGVHMEISDGHSTTCDAWDSNKATARIYLNSDYLNTIELSWQNIITNPKWFNVETSNHNGNFSKQEDTAMTEENYQIGLMYASDYYNSWDYVEANPSSSNTNTNSWLHITHGLSTSKEKYIDDEWTMTQGECAWLAEAYILLYAHITIFGDLNEKTTRNGNGVAIHVRPSFYLSPSILITGEGSEEHPFLITNIEELNN